MDSNEAKMQLEDEGYCVLDGQLDSWQAEHIDLVARRLMEE